MPHIHQKEGERERERVSTRVSLWWHMLWRIRSVHMLKLTGSHACRNPFGMVRRLNFHLMKGSNQRDIEGDCVSCSHEKGV